MPHATPQSIACCYEGNYCNMNITPVAYANADVGDETTITDLNDGDYRVFNFIVFDVEF